MKNKVLKKMILMLFVLVIILSLTSCFSVIRSIRSIRERVSSDRAKQTTTVEYTQKITSKSLTQTQETSQTMTGSPEETFEAESVEESIEIETETNTTPETSQEVETTVPPEQTENEEPTQLYNDDGLLNAKAFTTDRIIEEGPLYPRRKDFDPQFIKDALAYFPEVAGGNEFDESIAHILRKRDVQQPFRIRRYNVGEDDQVVLDQIFPAIESLTGLNLTYTDSSQSDMDIHIVPLDDFESIFGNNYVPGNWGFISYYWDSNEVIYYAQMAVANDVNTREEMNHLIIEEFVQGLGLPNDSYRYDDSIFQQEWTTVQEPSPIDWLLLEFVYRPELKPGMRISQCVEILEKLYLD